MLVRSGCRVGEYTGGLSGELGLGVHQGCVLYVGQVWMGEYNVDCRYIRCTRYIKDVYNRYVWQDMVGEYTGSISGVLGVHYCTSRMCMSSLGGRVH